MNFWMRAEHDVEGNRKRMKELEILGYRFKSDAYSYQVWFRDEYICGASSATRNKKHWRHRDADLKMYLFHAIITAHDHNSARQTEQTA